MKRRALSLCMLSLTLAFSIFWIASAQGTTYGTMQYGETVSGIIQDESPAPHIWEFEGKRLELVRVRLQRIGGQFTPRMILIAPDGSRIEPAPDDSDEDTQTLELPDGLPQTGTYRLEVSGEQAQNNVVNPSEYTLTLSQIGIRRSATDEGLSPLPTLGIDDMPDLTSGTRRADGALNIGLYNAQSVTQPDSIQRRNDYLIRGGGRSVALNNANPISRGIDSFSFVDDGVGFTLLGGGRFFTDQNITEFTHTQNITSLSLSNGQTFSLDFYRISHIQAVAGLVIVTTHNDQRMILNGTAFDFKRRGGINGEGPNAEPINEFRIDDAHIASDMQVWHTLALLPDNGPLTLRVLYGDDLRLISTVRKAELLQRGNSEKPELDPPGTDTRYLDLCLIEFCSASDNSPKVVLRVDPTGMGDIVTQQDVLSIRPLDGRQIDDSLSQVRELLIENKGLRFVRRNDSYRLSLPDRTDIETPPPDNLANPFPNFGKLGTTVFDYHPRFQLMDALLPYNRVTGNFHYPVVDFDIPSHTLGLTWARYYNSLAPAVQTPAYMLAVPQPYLFANVGFHWRHSYQYELDLTLAPHGHLTLILPEGSQHRFRRNNELYRSNSLLSWTIEQRDGITGYWIATNTAGETYTFDRAGRLQRITSADGGRLLFSPAPQALSESLGYVGGFFVTERYGRRIELYTDDNHQIAYARDMQQREIRYAYNPQSYLVGADYPDVTQSATYAYELGALVAIDDTRSPYSPHMALTYDTNGRLTSWVANAASDVNDGRGSPAVTTNILYEDLVTQETVSVNGVERVARWRYDRDLRLVGYDSPADISQNFQYDLNNGNFRAYGLFNGGNYLLVFDSFGYLTSLTDPRTNQYQYEYETIGSQRLLTRITYPAVENTGTPVHTFSYDENARLMRVSRLVSTRPQTVEQITDFTYDDLGRLETIRRQGAHGEEIITEYAYDDFGYLRRVTEGDEENKRVIGLQHDIAGRLRSVTDERGYVSTLDWNAERDLITTITREGEQLAYRYDEYGNLTEFTSPSTTENYLYNGLNQMIAFTNAAGIVTNYAYDEAGNLLRIELPDELNTGDYVYRYAYDANDELIMVELPDGLRYSIEISIAPGTSTTYELTNPAGDLTRFIYNLAGRLRTVQQIDSRGETTYNYNLTYTSMGSLATIQEVHDPASRNLTLTYDLLGNPLTSKIGNQDPPTRYTYNAAGYVQTVTDPRGQTIQYSYDPWGNVTALTFPDGTTYEYTYDESNNLISYQDALGIHEYIYTSQNRRVGYVDPLGNRTNYAYDPRGNMIEVIDANNNSRQAEYDVLNRLTQLVEADGTRTTFEYNERNLPVRINAPRGVLIGLTYDLWDNIIAQTYTSSREVLYAYDNLQRLVSSTNTLGYTEQYGYNNRNRVGRVLDPLGNVDVYSWGGSGRVATYTDKLGRTYTYVADNMGRLSRIVDPINNTDLRYDNAGNITEIVTNSISGSQQSRWRYEYDANGRLIRYANPEMANNVWWQFSYDGNDNLTSVITPDNQRTTYHYNEGNRLIRIEHPDGAVEQFEYDGVGNITLYIAPNGLQSEYQYDQKDRLTSRTDTATTGETLVYLYEYDEQDNLTRMVDPEGHTTRYIYDLFGNLNRLERSLGEDHVIAYRYQYDALNNLSSIQFPPLADGQPGHSINMTYNALNQRVRYVDAAARSWAYSYDSMGNLIQLSDPLGSVTSFTYDARNRPTRIRYPNGALVELRYEIQAQSDKMELPENFSEDPTRRQRIAYTFDRNQQLIGIEHGSRSVTRIQRDVMGRVQEVTMPDNRRISYTYDPRGRLRTITTPEGTIQRDYDVMGRLVRISGGGETYEYVYDDFGRLVELRQNSHNTRYTFDDVGNVTMIDAGPFGVTQYEYDTLYRVSAIIHDDSRLDIVYNDAGLPVRLSYDNGYVITYEYDPNGRIIAVGHTGTDRRRLDRFTYQYDAVGNIARITRADGWKVLYSYDPQHQLIGERWLDESNRVLYTVTYSYDHGGNRIESFVAFGQSTPQRTLYSYNDRSQLEQELRNASFDRIDRFTGATQAARTGEFTIAYTYDNAGNLTRISHPEHGDLNFSYDSLNRLLSVRGAGFDGEPIDTAVRYDALGRIKEIQAGGEVYRMTYGLDRLVGIQNANDGTTERYLYGLDGRLLWFDGAQGRRYPLYDAFGSVRHYVGEDSGLISNQIGLSYNAFGEIITPYGIDNSLELDAHPRQLYIGQWRDGASGIYIMGARAYLPHLGRFIQRDPVRYDPQGSLYAYAENRPGVYADPFGTQPQPIAPGLTAVLYSQQQIAPPLIDVLVPEIPALAHVAQQQELENQRMFDVARMARFQMNEIVTLTDPGLCDVYIGSVNPVPDAVRGEMNAALEQRAAGLYSVTQTHARNLAATSDPYQVLARADTHRHWALTGGNLLHRPGCDTRSPVPQGSVPDHLTHNTIDMARSFRNALAEVPLYPALAHQMPDMLAPSLRFAPSIHPQTQQQVFAPDIYPAYPEPLGQLAEQTRDWTFGTFFSPFIEPNPMQQDRTQVFDFSPPVIETFIRP